MKAQPLNKPTKLDVDLDQWRRDVQMFAATTKQALAGIVADLSSQCSGSRSEFEAPSDQRRTGSGTASNPASDGNRLSQLKAQLAERLNNKK